MSEESLLAVAGASTPSEESTTETTEAPVWAYAEGINGEGEKPEWFKDNKYKSISAQAEAYAGLESKLGGFTGAPDEYESSMPDGIEGEINTDDPMLEKFTGWAKENNLNQEAFTALQHMFIENEFNNQGVSREAELNALGDNAQSRLQNISDFAKANLSEDEYDGILAATTTAAGVKAIEALIAKTRTTIPTSPAEVDTGLSHSDIKARMSDPRYQSDPAFRAETSKMYERKFGKEPQRQTIG